MSLPVAQAMVADRAPATSRRRVILVGPAGPATGGMATVVENLCTSSLNREFELALINTAKMTPENRRWYIGVLHQLRLLLSLAALLLRSPGGLVHIHTCSGLTFWRDAACVGIARLFGKKAILHIHGGGFEDFIEGMATVQRFFLIRTFRASELVIVLSEDWRRRLAAHVPARRWAVIANGVPLPLLRTDQTPPDAFLFVGNLDEKKGVEDLVLATAIAVHKGFSSRVRLAGAETAVGQRAALCRLIERERIANRVELIGVVRDRAKAQAFAEARAFVLPSYVEALPMALLEAMSYGLPVIASNVGAVPEVVDDGVEGFLIKPGDVEALADRMTQLSRSAALRERMGSAGRNRVEAHHTIEAMASKIAHIYRETSGEPLAA
jgi:glycosyltransferase involved in cell wall biosynthesis